ncbi:putative rab6-interacting [Schistosoma mansoni]|nr:putative rab6-interacting [Schistosoma mansoni]|eukprot:XP_018653923.1 putative rab6-interacting [Schistosoma mansoni]
MPQGLNIFSQSSPLFSRFHLPQRHTFIITREDGTRVHGLALLFCELVTHEGFKEAVSSLQMIYAADLQSLRLSSPTMDGLNPGAIKECFAGEKDSLFTTKAIGLLSRHPFIFGLFNWLEDLWAMMYISPNTKCIQSTLEQCIHDMLFETKLPTVGQYVTFSTPFRTHYGYCPAPISPITNLMNGQLNQKYYVELSLFEYPIEELFELIDLDNFIRLFTCTLLEYRIILFSKVYYRLMLIAECVTCLLLPFYWLHVYAPILPVSLTHFVDAPVPFIMGINISDPCNNNDHQNEKYPFIKQYDSDNHTQAYFYSPSVELANEIPEFPNGQDIKQSLLEILKLAKHLSRIQGTRSIVSDVLTDTHNMFLSTLYVVVFQSLEVLKNTIRNYEKATYSHYAVRDFHFCKNQKPYIRFVCWRNGRRTSCGSSQPIRQRSYTKLLHINAAIRNLFLSNFTMIFQDYENYLILDRNGQKPDNIGNISCGLHGFDKVGFLSDQPETHLPFLSAFLETQMFASFLDSRIKWHNLSQNKIMHSSNSPSVHLTVFHLLLSRSRHERKTIFRSNNSNNNTLMNTALLPENINYDVVFDYNQQLQHNSNFPDLNAKPIFENVNCQTSNNDALKNLNKSDNMNSNISNGNNTKSLNRCFVYTHHQFADLQRNGMAQANWDFVDALLEECKHRTKRMVLKKIGQEAIEMGHCDPNISVVEENTLVSGLCDLLERIWSHGLNKKMGKSALWSHLVLYAKRVELMKQTNKELAINDSELLNLESSPPTSSSCSSSPRISDLRSVNVGSENSHLSSDLSTLSPDLQQKSSHTDTNYSDLRKIFGSTFIEHSLIDDIHSIQSMKTVKTDIGFARAFVRLALEKKLLSSHLTRLLMDTKLLRYLYTRYAFLRCEEEREQFLVHLLSLNAVDYFSFTRMINQTEIIYEIFICNGRKHSSGSTSTANAWIKIHGHFGSTQVIKIPHGHNLIEIKNRNLGLLSTLQIGHDNTGSAPKWFIEFIIVHNRVTNHFYLFPCYQWFGLGVEDDALERILIGEQIRIASNDPCRYPTECLQTLPNRCLSPSLSRRNSDQRHLNSIIIHERVANAVNCLLKFFCKTNNTNTMTTSLTSLWCGEHGLVPALHLVFTYGFRSSRIFQRKIYVWDYFVSTSDNLNTSKNQPIDILINNRLASMSNSAQQSALQFTMYVQNITNNSITFGKEGKFQRFICHALRDHLLSDWLSILAISPITYNMYEPRSFLLSHDLRKIIQDLLTSLDEFHLTFEPALLGSDI